MKTKRIILYMFVAMLLMVGCGENRNTNTLTTIYADGSCKKAVQYDANWQEIAKDTVPFFADYLSDGWQAEWKYKKGNTFTKFPPTNSEIAQLKIDTNSNENEFELIFKKKFSTIKEMSLSERINQSMGNLITYSFKKEFRWFYTYYTYTETYPKSNVSLTPIPISHYFTRDEANYWFTGNPDFTAAMNGIEVNDLSRKLEEKYTMWQTHVIWHKTCSVFTAHYDQIEVPNVSKKQFEALSDTVFNGVVSLGIDDFNFEVHQYLDQYFQTNKFSRFYAENETLFDSVLDSIIEKLMLESIVENYQLKLPGKVIDGNFIMQENETMYWRITPERMMVNDFVINATSRKPNAWAFAVAFLFVLLAIISWRYAKHNKR